MNPGPVYVLDSDVFMTPARSYYAFDLVPTFWDALVREARNGRLLSIDRVKDEIEKGNDKLKQWVNSDFHSWFDSTEREPVIVAYRAIMEWAQKQPQFSDAAKAEFADAKKADAWLVAYAKSTKRVVVTNEKYHANIRREIKIPNVCQEFRVAYVDVFQMLRALGLRLS